MNDVITTPAAFKQAHRYWSGSFLTKKLIIFANINGWMLRMNISSKKNKAKLDAIRPPNVFAVALVKFGFFRFSSSFHSLQIVSKLFKKIQIIYLRNQHGKYLSSLSHKRLESSDDGPLQRSSISMSLRRPLKNRPSIHLSRSKKKNIESGRNKTPLTCCRYDWKYSISQI